jgi:hypothetical protein
MGLRPSCNQPFGADMTTPLLKSLAIITAAIAGSIGGGLTAAALVTTLFEKIGKRN